MFYYCKSFHMLLFSFYFFAFIFQMVDIENPWNIASIYDLQFFNCPTCDFKDYAKQELVNHAYDFHPNSIPFLVNIKDESLQDVIFPWDTKEIKKEPEVSITEIDIGDIKTEVVKEELNDDYYIHDPEYTNPENVNMEFHCAVCNKDFPTQIKYKYHIKTVHGESVKCEKCNKVYKSLKYYKKHFRYAHEGVKNYNCKLCNVKFSNSSQLNDHNMQVHGSSSSQCEECGKSFKTKSYLEHHVRNMHGGQKDFACDQCEKSYTKRDRLKLACGLFEKIFLIGSLKNKFFQALKVICNARTSQKLKSKILPQTVFSILTM